MPFLPVSGGIPQLTTVHCVPASFTSYLTGGADGAADGGNKYG